MRFFSGMNAPEIAAVVSTTEATVRREWIIAKGWHYGCLERKARVQAAV